MVNLKFPDSLGTWRELLKSAGWIILAAYLIGRGFSIPEIFGFSARAEAGGLPAIFVEKQAQTDAGQNQEIRALNVIIDENNKRLNRFEETQERRFDRLEDKVDRLLARTNWSR